MFGIPWSTVVVISWVWEVGCVISINLSVIWCNMVWWAIPQTCGAAPSWSFRVYDHLRVSGYVSQHVPITGLAIVLPTATNINKVKLALGSSPFFDVQSQPHLKIWWLWKLKFNLNCKLCDKWLYHPSILKQFRSKYFRKQKQQTLADVNSGILRSNFKHRWL